MRLSRPLKLAPAEIRGNHAEKRALKAHSVRGASAKIRKFSVVYEDYKRIFGEEPPLLGGVAIMTDTDDTRDEATAWYGDIVLHAP